MRAICLLPLLLLACASGPPVCLSSLDLSVHGSESDGTSVSQARERWKTDDVTIGGSATLTIDLTGRCTKE